MRHWLFHPLIFYPLAILAAALLIAISVKPQSWPREPAPAAAQHAEGALVYAGEAFDAPAPAPEQEMTVIRDWLGRARTLRIAVRPDAPEPTPEEQGVRILLTPDDAARMDNRPVTIEVSYVPSAVNTASGLAVSLRGAGPAQWVSRDIPPQPATIRFRLPPHAGPNAIGLRALTPNDDQNYGLEITRIRVLPLTQSTAAN